MAEEPEEPAEQAALQIINVLFAVPQLSVRLDRLPERHMAMVRYWMGFWLEHRDILLDGRLKPRHPGLLYPLVESSLRTKRISVVYQADAVATEAHRRQATSNHVEEWTLINGTSQNRLILELLQEWGPVRVDIYDCTGEAIQQQISPLSPGLHSLPVPLAGTVRISRSLPYPRQGTTISTQVPIPGPLAIRTP